MTVFLLFAAFAYCLVGYATTLTVFRIGYWHVFGNSFWAASVALLSFFVWPPVLAMLHGRKLRGDLKL